MYDVLNEWQIPALYPNVLIMNMWNDNDVSVAYKYTIN